MLYSKPAIDLADQIQLLESRGLIIDDKSLAEHFLAYVSYYRLAGYWWPLQSDKINHIFKPGSQFQTVVDLYNFDRELRLVVFNKDQAGLDSEEVEIELFGKVSISKDQFRFQERCRRLKIQKRKYCALIMMICQVTEFMYD